jgi:hypothetical protein
MVATKYRGIEGCRDSRERHWEADSKNGGSYCTAIGCGVEVATSNVARTCPIHEIPTFPFALQHTLG